jgi:hypothetical protein
MWILSQQQQQQRRRRRTYDELYQHLESCLVSSLETEVNDLERQNDHQFIIKWMAL